MPVDWLPKRQTISEEIVQEEWETQKVKGAPVWVPPPPMQPIQPIAEEVAQPPAQPPIQPPAPIVQPLAQPVIPEVEAIQEPEAPLPFWQRALQVFTAPFEWIDENLIRPGLGTVGTAAGLVPEVKRKPGEDFFEWKKRSWAELKTPGIDINIPWSEEPLRLDIKGVLELAPWLLIPGAGWVGGGVRAGVGVAGALGKLGKIGRLAGRAVEYSPWGLVEKTAGAALKAGLKGVGKLGGKVSAKLEERAFGKLPEPTPLSPIVKEFGEFIDNVVVPQRKAFEKALPVELRAKQAGRLESIAKQYREGKISASQRLALEEKALEAGSLKAGFAVAPFKFDKAKMDELLEPIYKAAETNFEAKDAAQALRNLLLDGVLPEPRHFVQFARAYGAEFSKSIKTLASISSKDGGKLLDLLNAPRAILASGDLSATFRQGLILMLTHPTKAPRAFWRQLKYFSSEKLANEMDDALRSHPLYDAATKEWGVEFTTFQKGARMLQKEEIFYSNLAEQLPFIRRSERAFTGFLNEMRMGAVEGAYHAMTAQGATKEQLKLMGKFINLASGRGKLPANLDQYAPVFNTLLFSAKYQMSTLQLPRQIGRMLLSKNPYMRREAATALVAFIGGGSAILGLLKATGNKVELDPRSGDFGKVIIGKTRLDIWRGYIQYARFMAQMATGERKSAYGNMSKVARADIAFRFLQSKSSPAFGLMVDLLKGENYMGEPLFNETTGFIKTARNRLLPLAVQDVMDAMEQYGVNGLWTAAPAFLGVGVLTYVNDLVLVKQKIAREMGFDTWDEIDPKTQRQIENTNVELQVAYIDFDRQVMGTAWGDWRNAGKAIDSVFTENVELASAQFRATGDGVKYRKKIADAFTARRGGYDARDKEARFEEIVRRNDIEDTAESLLSLGPEQLAIKLYNDALYGDDMYDEFGDYRFDEADARREQLMVELNQMQPGLFEYVEDYQGLKYELLPPEFHQLVRAKELTRPYWQIKNRVEEIFGKPDTEWAEKRIEKMVARLRKQMKNQWRVSNPEALELYELFYTEQ